MAKYRKKPVVIEAVKVKYAEMLANGPEHSPFEEMPDWLRSAIDGAQVVLSTNGARDYAVLAIRTLEGVMEATPGDFIIRGVKGELYPCKPDIFEATYDLVPDEEPAHHPV
jgi:hypothetical protein